MKEIDLKKSYSLRLKVGFLSALAILIAGFTGFPSYSPSLYIPTVEPVQDTLITVDEVLPPEAIPPPLPAPAIPEEAETGEDVDIPTIPTVESSWRRLAEQVPQPPPPGAFTPYDRPPRAIRAVTPEYPDIARMAEIEGTVWLHLLIDTEGRVRDVLVLDPLTEACDSAAVRAARQFLFSPALQNDKPVTVWASLPVKFELNE